MNEDKELLTIIFEVSKILREKYYLDDEEIIEYFNEYGLKTLYEYFPEQVMAISYSTLAKSVFETVTAERTSLLQETRLSRKDNYKRI